MRRVRRIGAKVFTSNTNRIAFSSKPMVAPGWLTPAMHTSASSAPPSLATKAVSSLQLFSFVKSNSCVERFGPTQPRKLSNPFALMSTP